MECSTIHMGVLIHPVLICSSVLIRDRQVTWSKSLHRKEWRLFLYNIMRYSLIYRGNRRASILGNVELIPCLLIRLFIYFVQFQFYLFYFTPYSIQACIGRFIYYIFSLFHKKRGEFFRVVSLCARVYMFFPSTDFWYRYQGLNGERPAKLLHVTRRDITTVYLCY
jgi:hypothetical protein